MASSMEDPNLDTSYSRRLDRTPETDKSNVARLSTEDRQKIYGLRTVFGNTLNKLQKLEEDNDEKDLMIDRERQLRKNLEDKLMETKLVDMYSDPAVNEELHERLPRAAKERMYSLNDTPRTGRRHKKKKGGRGADNDSGSEEDRSYSRQYHSYPGAMPYPGGPAYMPSPGYYGWPPGMMMPPPNYPQQQMQHSTPYNPGASSANQVPQLSNMYMTPWGPQYAQGHNTQQGEAQGQNVGEKTGLKVDDISVIKAASMLSADSKERQISRLLHEIDLLKDQNRKVSGELAEQITERDKLKIEKDLRDVSNEEQISSRVSILVQEIYEKQKQRDKAIMGRLKLANEERDKALILVTSLKQGQSMLDILSEDEDDEVKKTLMTTLDMEYKTGDILDTIHGSTQKSREIHTKHIRGLTSERDAGQAKISELEMELLRTQRQLDDLLPIQEEQLQVKKQLSMTQHERDMALTKLRNLEEENNNLKIYYGLHKSLSKEQSWKEQYNNSLNQMQQLIAQRDGTVIDAQKETNKLQEIIQEVTEERDSLSMNLEKLQASDSEHLKINEKLQRHVNVLQKKLKKLSTDQGTV